MIGQLNTSLGSTKMRDKNSISRVTLAEQIEVKKKNGVVYTPSNLANFVADKVVEYFIQTLPHLDGDAVKNLRILDPACGNGELLVAVWKSLLQSIPGQSKSSSLEPSRVLCGIDIDKGAIRHTKQRIASLSPAITESSHFNLLKTNALFPFNKSSREGWRAVKRRFTAECGFDILIANPPWGADTQMYDNRLSNGEFMLYKGQFDTSDLFVELALSIVKSGGCFAFIVPDSLFNRERTQLRQRLVEETQILYIGRFGEKFFKGTNRACAVLICKKSRPTPATTVECMRLTPQLRNGVLSGTLNFQETETAVAHAVHQSRFTNNDEYLFDIDLREDEEVTLRILKRHPSTFRDYLLNYRGIELSKKGDVCRCEQCGLWLAYPRVRHPICPHCKSPLDLLTIESARIISHEETTGYYPILVGESIKRYLLAAPYWIATNKMGINYKDASIYAGPKIVVRKTGVGLLASIDYSGRFTNQVVYIFKIKPSHDKPLPIELFLAILNSRAMYYYLVKTHGETEWRSHPYLTQGQILNLPLPDLEGVNQKPYIADRIVRTLKPFLARQMELPIRVDAEIEYLVAKLYGLSEEDYTRIYQTLQDVQDLLPIKPLKIVSIHDIFLFRDSSN